MVDERLSGLRFLMHTSFIIINICPYIWKAAVDSIARSHHISANKLQFMRFIGRPNNLVASSAIYTFLMNDNDVNMNAEMFISQPLKYLLVTIIFK